MADFTNIDGVYAKDAELRSGIDTLRTTVLSNTIKPLTVTKNGTYTAIPSSGTYGYSPITVDVQEEPWEPLQDGYSNFWFELTDDTLSPWLNFSSKTESAVIDWGDGSGEVALDTLTPTHTYAKAGKYVVKVKGVTGIAQQYRKPLSYINVLTAVELNNDVLRIQSCAFQYMAKLSDIVIPASVIYFGQSSFEACPFIKSIDLTDTTVTALGNALFNNCMGLQSVTFNSTLETINQNAFSADVLLRVVTIPASVTTIGYSAFWNCKSLSEVHCQATTPPTLGNNVFGRLPSDWLCYVPVGTGETYKAAEGWSTYADHILEEGQTPNRMMLAKFNSENTDNEEMR